MPPTVPVDLVLVRRIHDATHRLLVELLLIGAVLLAGLTVPADDAPGTHWSLLAPYVLFTAHVLLGLLVLVDAARVARCTRRVAPDARVLVLAGLVASATAVGTGAVSVLGLTDRSPGALMVFGWLLAFGVYARLWFATRSLLRRTLVPGRQDLGSF